VAKVTVYCLMPTHYHMLARVEQQTSEFSKNSEVLRLTQRGRLLGNQVFMRFV